jgi:hypothetical protein
MRGDVTSGKGSERRCYSYMWKGNFLYDRVVTNSKDVFMHVGVQQKCTAGWLVGRLSIVCPRKQRSTTSSPSTSGRHPRHDSMRKLIEYLLIFHKTQCEYVMIEIVG